MTTQTQNAVIPDGYRLNDKGHLIPVDKIKEIDKLRDETVKKLVGQALSLQIQMRSIKEQVFGEFHNFVELSAQEYDTQIGGKKGNVTLMSFDGKYKVQIAISDNLVFDERLQVAKSLIDECLTEWTKTVTTTSKPSLITPLRWTRKVKSISAVSCPCVVSTSQTTNGKKQ